MTAEFRAFLRQEREDLDAIRVKRLYIEVAGDVACGVLLSNLVYWHSEDRYGHQRLRVQRDGFHWLARSSDELFDECGLTPKQAARCIRQLEEMGVIATARYRFNGAPTRHFRIVPERFMACVDGARERLAARRGTDRIVPFEANGYRPKGQMEYDQRSLSISTKGPIPITSSTTASTTASPLPPEGEAAAPPEAPPVQREVAQAPEPSGSEARETPPPTPSPRDLGRAEQRMLDMRRSVDSQSSRRPRRGDAWADQDPERLAKIERTLWACWREKNPNKVTQRDLKLIRSSIAPDEVARFVDQTTAYLSYGFGDPEYMKSLRTWLSDWRDWVKPDRAPQSKAASAPSVYEEIALMNKITGRNMAVAREA